MLIKSLFPNKKKSSPVNKTHKTGIVTAQPKAQNASPNSKKITRLPRVIPIIDAKPLPLPSSIDEQALPPEHGTFCGIINKQLITAQCPLPRGTCVWKHRSTGFCKYTKDANLTLQSLALLVGEHVPKEETVVQLKSVLLETLKRELT